MGSRAHRQAVHCAGVDWAVVVLVDRHDVEAENENDDCLYILHHDDNNHHLDHGNSSDRRDGHTVGIHDLGHWDKMVPEDNDCLHNHPSWRGLDDHRSNVVEAYP